MITGASRTAPSSRSAFSSRPAWAILRSRPSTSSPARRFSVIARLKASASRNCSPSVSSASFTVSLSPAIARSALSVAFTSSTMVAFIALSSALSSLRRAFRRAQ
ncbi:MAG: hypothetical protein DPW22_06695 [Alphaproteobacteria bacterium]|nr:hypothetical protein [Alphaproteobacteria bacterium]